VTLNVTANSTNQKVTVQNNGVLVGSEPAINFIPGTYITISTADDAANSRSNVTISTSGLGTMATQNANSVAITGGTIQGVSLTIDSINNTPVGNITPSTGAFTNLTITGNTVIGLTGYLYGNGSGANVTASPTIPVANVTGAVANTVNVIAGTGLSGGGALTGNVTLNIANTAVTAGSYTYASFTVNAQGQLTAASSGTAPVTSVSGTAGQIASTGGTTPVLSLVATTVTAASYGNASTVATFTVDAYGRLTAAANASIAISNTQVSGLGTISTQNANNVTITGGSISNVSLSNVSINTSIVTKSANYTAAAADDTILANASTGVVTITLPTAVGVAGKVYTVKKIDSSANAVTVATTSSQTIDGVTTYSLANQYGGVNVQSDGSNWYIIANIFGRNGSTGTF
jgi:hypothetical protein